MSVTWTHPFLHEILDAIPTNIKSLIDIGCGKGIVGALVRIYRNPVRLVGLDIFPPYLDFCRKWRMYDEVYLCDIRKLPLPFGFKEFDCLTCIETIEHLEKANGERLISELERISKIIIITTPAHPTPSENYDNNPYRKHKDFWSQSDFQKKGYHIKGIGNYALPFRNLPLDARSVTSRFPHLFQFLLAKKQTT